MRRTLALAILGLFGVCSGLHAEPPAPHSHVLSGIVIARDQDGSHAAPAKGLVVGVYSDAIPIGGPEPYPPPKPVATARTDADGVFRIRGLASGRWFVAATGGADYGPGRWVTYLASRGASVTLNLCRDCPVPL